MCRVFLVCRTLLLVFFGLSLLVGERVQAKPQRDDIIIRGDVVSFSPLRQEVIDLVLDSIQSRSPLIIPPLKRSQQVHPNIAGIWAGAETQIDSTLGEVVLKFRPTAEARIGRHEAGKRPFLDDFEITLAIRPRGLFIRHSHATKKGVQRGVEVALSYNGYGPSMVDFIPGMRDSGAYIGIPGLDASLGDRIWSAYVCPREHLLRPSKTSVDGVALELLTSPYELSEVKVDYKAELQARIPAEFREERLKIHAAYSAHLPKSSVNSDEVRGLSPTLYMPYKPQQPFSFFYFQPAKSIQEGLLAMVEMENPVGYVRRQYFSDVTYVQRVDDSSPVPITVKGLVPHRDEGSCYLVLMQKSVWSEYDVPKSNESSSIQK